MSASPRKNNKRAFGSNTTKDFPFNGLRNQGSTCYLNSVLQVLFMSTELREAVKRHTEENRDTDRIDRQLSQLFEKLQTDTAETIGITNKLGIRSVNKQSDAAEYFEKILKLASPAASQIFEVKLVHTTECLLCHNETNEEGKFWHLPLTLESSDEPYSVVKGIEEFFEESELIGEDQLYCDNCHKKYDATIKCELKDHPDILMLMLKRFEFDYRYMSYIKNNCAVRVPYTLDIPQGQIYDLYAFVEHFGSMRGGHYTATIKSQDNRGARWFNFNDSSVQPLNQNLFNQDNVKNFLTESHSPYLLFYRKRKGQRFDAVNTDGGENAVGVENTAATDSSNRNEGPPLKRRVSDKYCSAEGLSDPCSTEVLDDRVSVEQSKPSHQTTEGRDERRCENIPPAQDGKPEIAKERNMRDEEGEIKAATNVEKQRRKGEQLETGSSFQNSDDGNRNLEVDVVIKGESDHVAEQHQREESVAKATQTRAIKSVGGAERAEKTKGKSKASKVAPGSDELNSRHDARMVHSQPKSNTVVKGSVPGVVSEDVFIVTTNSSSVERNESENQDNVTNTASDSKKEKKPNFLTNMKRRLTGKDKKKDKKKEKQVKMEKIPDRPKQKKKTKFFNFFCKTKSKVND